MPPRLDQDRREMARSLRRAGYSRAQISRKMGLKSGGAALGRWLQGVPPPAWTRRPRAKDHLREEAIRLRRSGASYRQISDELGVSKSTLSGWLQHVPLTDEHRKALAQRRRSAVQRRADALRAASRARHRSLVRESEGRIRGLTDRELFVAGVAAYWAEGTKTKPWGSRSSVRFTNSDPGMVTLFLRWLDLLGIGRSELTFRVAIHESGDPEGATRFWSEVVGVPPSCFQRPTIKRHNPRTTRKNVASGYRGCLVIRVRRSTDLNARIEGWFSGVVRAAISTRRPAPSIL